ncbi:MAG: sulfatase family protein [Opitutales bacterium]
MRLSTLLLALLVANLVAADETRPTIVVFLADDLGTGDVTALSGSCRIRTPYLDGFAVESTRLTDYHTSSSVCTPTRYGILTGRYAWRTRLQAGVLDGKSPPLIPSARPTLASVLRDAGYRTVCIGKWHLGLEWQKGPDGRPDYSQPFRGGPLALGFETFHGIAASADMPPYVLLEGDRATLAPTATFGKDLKHVRPGPAAPGWKADELLELLTQRAISELRKCRDDKRPLLLYVPLPSPHTPIAPSAKWRGRSGINAYADFVMETDHSIGRILMALQETGRAEDALVVITSDNGCSPTANFAELREEGHHPSAGFRGMKSDLYEGGHRVPCMVRWPKRIARGGSSDALAGSTDLYATCLAAAGVTPPPGGGEDSVSLLPVLRGETRSVRETYVMHSIDGRFAFRKGALKYLACRGSGGWSSPNAKDKDYLRLPPDQLFDLQEDPSEETNLARARPADVEKLWAELSAQVKAGRTTPGPASANDIEVQPKRD